MEDTKVGNENKSVEIAHNLDRDYMKTPDVAVIKKERDIQDCPTRDHERSSMVNQQKTKEGFQESMQEDMRGPMEGMEEVPEKK